MTEEKQRIAIAEICNFTSLRFVMGDLMGLLYGQLQFVPDYLNSLDAMHGAKKLLTEEKRGQMLDHLCEIVRRDHNPDLGPMTAILTAFFAEAKQEAEAFLRTFNRWEE